MALVTAFVGFATLTLIPIPMIRELGITASIGVAYKIVTNLIMLPVAASYFSFDQRFVDRALRLREQRARIMAFFGRIATTRNAAIGTLASVVLFGIAFHESQSRHVGHLMPGAPELHADSRYNRDAAEIVKRFDLGLDVLTVVFETPRDGCYQTEIMAHIDQFAWQMSNVPGVLSVASVAQLGKQAFLFEEFLMREGNKGLKLDLKPIPGGKAVVHGHCHQKAFAAMKAMKKVLAWIPEFEFEIVDSSCCGMSGSFGLEAEHVDVSKAMGELALLPAVRAVGPGALIVADGFSCRHQIHDGTGRDAVHVAVLLARALG